MDVKNRNSLYLCIDQGGHASRAIVFTHEGVMVCSAYTEVKTLQSAKHLVEYQAEDILVFGMSCDDDLFFQGVGQCLERMIIFPVDHGVKRLISTSFNLSGAN